MGGWNRRCWAALSTLVILASSVLLSVSVASADEHTTFKQGDGYAAGKYDIQGAQPTADNWERRSRYAAVAGSPPKMKWKLATGDWASSAPVIGSDGTIYVKDENFPGKPKVYAIRPDGTVKWKFEAQSNAAFSGSPVIAADGTIYVSSTHLYAINPETGVEKWRFKIGLQLSPPAIASDGTIYVGSNDGTLYAINQTNGKLKWSVAPFGDEIVELNQVTPIVGKDGTIYMSANYESDVVHFVIAIDPVSKKLKWKFNVLVSMYGSPVIGPDGTIYATSGAGYLFAIRPNGTEKWRFNTGEWIGSSPALAEDGTIYTGTSGAYVYAVNPNGSLKWKFATDSNHAFDRAPLVDANGTIYMATLLPSEHTADGYLYAINPNGSKKWIFKVSHSKIGGTTFADIAEPAIGADGTIYFGANTKEFYAIRASAPLLEIVEAQPPVATEGPPQVPSPDQPELPVFSDIAGNWAESSIIKAAMQQIVTGFPDNTYRPNQAVTRAQFSVMLMRTLGIKESDKALSFADADEIPAWAKQAVATAAQQGYVQGYENGTFRPDAKITQVEMASVVARVLKLAVDSNVATSFADDTDIPKWAKGTVEAARQYGVVTGRSNNRFEPQAAVTRAEAAVILLRLTDHLE
ncbi:S-layer homology domain-containing protein [Cohnella mopanensis]|uniref:S-layer homology domain-containing protein n=1 Tax=Cohnella mopanensis TaxID=2911966 RepID=UPI001EF8C936|nr:PQQ-binding-like beta-propeller repeat protein [Cohnella mopanensis]